MYQDANINWDLNFCETLWKKYMAVIFKAVHKFKTGLLNSYTVGGQLKTIWKVVVKALLTLSHYGGATMTRHRIVPLREFLFILSFVCGLWNHASSIIRDIQLDYDETMPLRHKRPKRFIFKWHHQDNVPCEGATETLKQPPMNP